MNATVAEETLGNAYTIGQEEEAMQIVRNNMLWAMGLSAVPVPVFDMLAVGGFQARALNELGELYGQKFSANLVKNLVASLTSGVGSSYFGQMLAGSVMKFIPVVGPFASLASTPIAAGALTYATGVVFVQHFESGGTFLDFDPKAVREFFREQFSEGLKEAANVATGSKTDDEPKKSPSSK